MVYLLMMKMKKMKMMIMMNNIWKNIIILKFKKLSILILQKIL